MTSHAKQELLLNCYKSYNYKTIIIIIVKPKFVI